jgi:hypothetical protein
MENNSSSSSGTLKSFLCVDYPAYVKNESEAIRTLGGMDRLTQTFSRRHSKLLLNYTPDNIFAKLICSSSINEAESEQQDTDSSSQTPAATIGTSSRRSSQSNFSNEDTGGSGSAGGGVNYSTSKLNDFIAMPCLLMSVRKSSAGIPTASQGEAASIKYEAKLVGRIKKVYTFQKLADFQYLPMSSSSVKIPAAAGANEEASTTQNKTTSLTQFNYTSFYDNFLFKNIQDYDHELRKNNLSQLFILPPFFSRFDDPVNYAFKSEPTKKPEVSSNDQQEITAAAASTAGSSKTSDNDGEEMAAVDDYDDENETENVTNGSNKAKSSSDSNELIRSVRQERSSQALLVNFHSKLSPTSRPQNTIVC